MVYFLFYFNLKIIRFFCRTLYIWSGRVTGLMQREQNNSYHVL